jgi:hypothetical protein
MPLSVERGYRQVRSWGLTTNLARTGRRVRVAGTAAWARRETGIGRLLPSPLLRRRVVHTTGDISRVHSQRWACRASIGWWRDRVKYTKERGPAAAPGVEARPQLRPLVLTPSGGLQDARSRLAPTLHTPRRQDRTSPARLVPRSGRPAGVPCPTPRQIRPRMPAISSS